MIDELREVFDINANIYNIIRDSAAPDCAEVETGTGKRSGFAWLDDSYIWSSAHGGYAGTTAHEIGHAFGLEHDFRDDAYIMSYGSRPDRLSAYSAESFVRASLLQSRNSNLKKGRRRPSNSFRRVPIRPDQKASPSNSKSQIRKAFTK